MALADNLVAYYSQEDTTGTDATGRGNTLTAVNTPTSVLGIVGNGVSYASASSQYQTRADNADLSMGDIDFTIAGWLKATTLPGAASLFGKWHSSGGATPKEYWVGTVGTTLAFYVSSDGSAQTNINFGTTLATATWYFVVAWHDSVGNTINITANDGTVASASYSSGVFDGTSPFRLGAMASDNNYQNGILDEVGVWKRVLSAAEITELYNAGSGRDYAYIAAAAGQPAGRLLGRFWGG